MCTMGVRTAIPVLLIEGGTVERKAIIEFVRKNPISHMGTVEEGQPRVRAMQTAHIDEEGLTFCTGAHKPVSKQLLSDPAVELSYWSKEDGLQLRIRGQMEHLESVDLKKHIVDTTFTFLKPVVEEHGYESLALFRLFSGEYRTWNSKDGGSEETGAF